MVVRKTTGACKSGVSGERDGMIDINLQEIVTTNLNVDKNERNTSRNKRCHFKTIIIILCSCLTISCICIAMYVFTAKDYVWVNFLREVDAEESLGRISNTSSKFYKLWSIEFERKAKPNQRRQFRFKRDLYNILYESKDDNMTTNKNIYENVNTSVNNDIKYTTKTDLEMNEILTPQSQYKTYDTSSEQFLVPKRTTYIADLQSSECSQRLDSSTVLPSTITKTTNAKENTSTNHSNNGIEEAQYKEKDYEEILIQGNSNNLETSSQIQRSSITNGQHKMKGISTIENLNCETTTYTANIQSSEYLQSKNSATEHTGAITESTHKEEQINKNKKEYVTNQISSEIESTSVKTSQNKMQKISTNLGDETTAHIADLQTEEYSQMPDSVTEYNGITEIPQIEENSFRNNHNVSNKEELHKEKEEEYTIIESDSNVVTSSKLEYTSLTNGEYEMQTSSFLTNEKTTRITDIRTSEYSQTLDSTTREEQNSFDVNDKEQFKKQKQEENPSKKRDFELETSSDVEVATITNIRNEIYETSTNKFLSSEITSYNDDLVHNVNISAITVTTQIEENASGDNHSNGTEEKQLHKEKEEHIIKESAASETTTNVAYLHSSEYSQTYFITEFNEGTTETTLEKDNSSDSDNSSTEEEYIFEESNSNMENSFEIENISILNGQNKMKGTSTTKFLGVETTTHTITDFQSSNYSQTTPISATKFTNAVTEIHSNMESSSELTNGQNEVYETSINKFIGNETTTDTVDIQSIEYSQTADSTTYLISASTEAPNNHHDNHWTSTEEEHVLKESDFKYSVLNGQNELHEMITTKFLDIETTTHIVDFQSNEYSHPSGTATKFTNTVTQTYKEEYSSDTSYSNRSTEQDERNEKEQEDLGKKIYSNMETNSEVESSSITNDQNEIHLTNTNEFISNEWTTYIVDVQSSEYSQTPDFPTRPTSVRTKTTNTEENLFHNNYGSIVLGKQQLNKEKYEENIIKESDYNVETRSEIGSISVTNDQSEIQEIITIKDFQLIDRLQSPDFTIDLNNTTEQATYREENLFDNNRDSGIKKVHLYEKRQENVINGSETSSEIEDTSITHLSRGNKVLGSESTTRVEDYSQTSDFITETMLKKNESTLDSHLQTSEYPPQTSESTINLETINFYPSSAITETKHIDTEKYYDFDMSDSNFTSETSTYNYSQLQSVDYTENNFYAIVDGLIDSYTNKEYRTIINESTTPDQIELSTFSAKRIFKINNLKNRNLTEDDTTDDYFKITSTSIESPLDFTTLNPRGGLIVTEINDPVASDASNKSNVHQKKSKISSGPDYLTINENGKTYAKKMSDLSFTSPKQRQRNYSSLQSRAATNVRNNAELNQINFTDVSNATRINITRNVPENSLNLLPRISLRNINNLKIKNSGTEFVRTSQQSAVNQDFRKTICPTFLSSTGYPILQQETPLSYTMYNYNQINPFASYVPFTLTKTTSNPYMGQLQYPFSSYTKSVLRPNSYFLHNTNGQNIMTPAQGGQNYICNPIPSAFNNLDEIPDVEIKDAVDNSNLQLSFGAEENTTNTRASDNCPYGERSCDDNSKCIKINNFCDGEVQCKDASDEAFCPCTKRLGKSRVCDGYLDCPNGEDENECFSCEKNMFNCDDWSSRERVSSCIPIEQRCDGIVQCPTEKDERDCSILVDRVSEKQKFLVSKTIGFLYRNFKGHWYPTCHNTVEWANEACRNEIGSNMIAPLVHLVAIETKHNGPYLSSLAGEETKVEDSCESGAAAFVECPPLICGMRIKSTNHYRQEEIDTSAEKVLSKFQGEREYRQIENDTILGDSRVVGGKPSQPKAWPWIISVYRNGIFHCGGALINEMWIITAAHCVSRYWHYYYEVQAGVLRRYSYSPTVQDRTVSYVISHNLYDQAKLKNDIALMKLSQPLYFNRYVHPICLPSEITAGKNFIWGPEPGTLCTAVGWGATIEHGTDPDHLREVKVPVHKQCKHREDEEGREICAGLREGGKDACQGDSGGPFMCRNPNLLNQWYLAGIVSHGEGCARPNEPGVYTRVSLFLEWIYDNIRAETSPQTKPLHRCPGYVCKRTKTCIANKRRCDKIIDCLDGDDEMRCDKNKFNDIFKHVMRQMLLGVNQDTSINNITADTTEFPDVRSASTVDSDEIPPTTPDSTFHNGESASSAITANILNGDYLTETSTTESAISNVTPSWRFPTMPMSIKTFKCKIILQVIEIMKRCDHNVDCEDATDENECTCADYLRHPYPQAICDGVTDCLDKSDEENCSSCTASEYHCKRSGTCITKNKICNDVEDCPLGDDEEDCFALTNGKNIELDKNDRPHVNRSGILSVNRNGNWKVLCNNWSGAEATLAADMCFYSGYSDYKYFLKVPVRNTILNVTNAISGFAKNASAATDGKIKKCVGLYIKCTDAVHIKHDVQNITNVRFKSIKRTVEVPWNAEIYVNGTFTCTGLLLEINWVMTSNKCKENGFRLNSDYVTVLLGGWGHYLNVLSPHEQIIEVTETVAINNSDVLLLRLQKNIGISRYIRPMTLNTRKYLVSETGKCIATGRNWKNLTALIYLKPTVNCSEDLKCFHRQDLKDKDCYENNNNNSWNGIIVCESKHGWYPAAVFDELMGACGFSDIVSYTNVQFLKAIILKSTKQTASTVAAQLCNGIRCDLGQCIENTKICDGFPDCPDGRDEATEYCLNFKTNCQLNSTCNCLKSDMKCRNGKCVPKVKFCDKINDCGDWSDEPDTCNCRSYLSLAHPEWICDGIRNCQDRSDEDPDLCSCNDHNFSCEKSDRCVARDVVCDGISDCPGGEDEEKCIALISSSKRLSSEVYIRTAGMWHPGCFSKSLATTQLEDICRKIGFTGRSATKIIPEKNSVTKIGWRPEIDPFMGIWLQENNGRKIMIAMRDGSKPFVHLKPDNSCYRLFLECI